MRSGSCILLNCVFRRLKCYITRSVHYKLLKVIRIKKAKYFGYIKRQYIEDLLFCCRICYFVVESVIFMVEDCCCHHHHHMLVQRLIVMKSSFLASSPQWCTGPRCILSILVCCFPIYISVCLWLILFHLSL